MAVNNYEQWRRDWQARFCSMDKEALLRKLPELSMDSARIYLSYFGHRCGIRLEDGAIEAPQDWHKLTLMDEMNIFTHLWYSREGAALTGDWLPFAQLKNASPFDLAFQRGNLRPFADTFSGHGEALRNVLMAYGGRKLPVGDVAYELDVFPSIPMQVLFWEGDEDFPAQVNLLFDRSATDFIHVESVVTIASEALGHLALDAGVPLIGASFDIP